MRKKNSELERSVRELRALSLDDRMIVCGIDQSLWEAIRNAIQSEISLKAIDLNSSPDSFSK